MTLINKPTVNILSFDLKQRLFLLAHAAKFIKFV